MEGIDPLLDCDTNNQAWEFKIISTPHNIIRQKSPLQRISKTRGGTRQFLRRNKFQKRESADFESKN